MNWSNDRVLTNSATETVFNRGQAKKLPPEIHSRAKRKLNLIDAASSLGDLKVLPANRVNQIINGKREITGDTAIRFGLALGTSPEMWLRLQSRYELEKAQDESDPDLENKIKRVAT